MPIETLYAARNLNFAPTLEFDYEGAALPLTGATISFEVREFPGASGTPLASDETVTFTDVVHPNLPGWRRLTVLPELAQSVLKGLPGQNEPSPGDAQTFVEELKITYADGMQDSLLSGEFVLSAGVNYA